MALTITDATTVRAVGSLADPADPNGSAGAPTDSQVGRAIRDARREMLLLFSKVDYNAVKDFSEDDLEVEANADKQEAFRNAESCFAIAQFPRILNASQLAATGLIQSTEIGKARKSFAPSEEGQKIKDKWDREAYRWLSPYLSKNLTTVDATTKEVTSFTSKDQKFYVSTL